MEKESNLSLGSECSFTIHQTVLSPGSDSSELLINRDAQLPVRCIIFLVVSPRDLAEIISRRHCRCCSFACATYQILAVCWHLPETTRTRNMEKSPPIALSVRTARPRPDSVEFNDVFSPTPVPQAIKPRPSRCCGHFFCFCFGSSRTVGTSCRWSCGSNFSAMLHLALCFLDAGVLRG